MIRHQIEQQENSNDLEEAKVPLNGQRFIRQTVTEGLAFYSYATTTPKTLKGSEPDLGSG